MNLKGQVGYGEATVDTGGHFTLKGTAWGTDKWEVRGTAISSTNQTLNYIHPFIHSETIFQSLVVKQLLC